MGVRLPAHDSDRALIPAESSSSAPQPSVRFATKLHLVVANDKMPEIVRTLAQNK